MVQHAGRRQHHAREEEAHTENNLARRTHLLSPFQERYLLSSRSSIEVDRAEHRTARGCAVLDHTLRSLTRAHTTGAVRRGRVGDVKAAEATLVPNYYLLWSNNLFTVNGGLRSGTRTVCGRSASSWCFRFGTVRNFISAPRSVVSLILSFKIHFPDTRPLFSARDLRLEGSILTGSKALSSSCQLGLLLSFHTAPRGSPRGAMQMPCSR